MLTRSARRLRKVLAEDTPATRKRLRRKATRPAVAVRTLPGWARTCAAAVLGGLVAGAVAGPVAAFAGCAYTGVAAWLIGRSRKARTERARLAAALDGLADAAAALRAGGGMPDLSLVDSHDLRTQAIAALVLSERTGAPLAELLERVEGQHRQTIRAGTRAGAEAAGATATAAILAALPVAGLGLGAMLGADPLRVLLHTPLGAVCAVGGIVCQLAGVTWVVRLTTPRSVPPVPPRWGRLPGAVAAVLAGAVLAVLIGGLPGLTVGLLGAGGLVAHLYRSEPPELRYERTAARRDLPLAADLLAAALRAGSPFDHCLLAVAETLPGALGTRLHRAGRSLRLGAPMADALRHLADLDGAARLVTAAERSVSSGAALAGVLQRTAATLRDLDALADEARVRRSGALIVLPLGLCFLPAFLLAGLGPVLIALLGNLTL